MNDDANVQVMSTSTNQSSCYYLNMRSGGYDYLIRIEKNKDETIGRKGTGEQSDHPIPMYPDISRLLLSVNVTDETIKFSLLKRDGEYGLFIGHDHVVEHEKTMTMEDFKRQSVEICLRDHWRPENYLRDNRMMCFSPGTLY